MDIVTQHTSLWKGAQTLHVERIDLDSDNEGNNTKKVHGNRKYPFVATSVTDSALPFIPEAEIAEKRAASAVAASSGGEPDTAQDLWIVVDSIVYDCTSFIEDHPGGRHEILAFVGEDCSWQFWRFHNKTHMREIGRPLRIGRTAGVRNRFTEPKSHVGSMGFRDDDWEE